MQKLWQLFWFRALACLAAVPPLMVATVMSLMLFFEVVVDGGDLAEALPDGVFLMLMLAVAAVTALPFWAAMEVLNHRWRRVLPPRFIAAFVVILSAAFMVALYGHYRLNPFGLYGEQPAAAWLLLSVSLAPAVVLTFVVLVPLIVRWRKRTETADEVSGVF